MTSPGTGPNECQAYGAGERMTVAIASFQRRELVARLVSCLSSELVSNCDLAARVDVVVVLDGSTDGSKELLESMCSTYPVPLTILWQVNQGLSGTRNAGLAAARGERVLFLDDDLVPSPQLLSRHLQSQSTKCIVVGACLVPAWASTPSAGARTYWHDRHAALAAKG